MRPVFDAQPGNLLEVADVARDEGASGAGTGLRLLPSRRFGDPQHHSAFFVDDTAVRDLEPLKDMPLKKLYIDRSGVTDLKTLQKMQLEDIRLDPGAITQGLDILRNMKSLKTIGLNHYHELPAAEFWADALG